MTLKFTKEEMIAMTIEKKPSLQVLYYHVIKNRFCTTRSKFISTDEFYELYPKDEYEFVGFLERHKSDVSVQIQRIGSIEDDRSGI